MASPIIPGTNRDRTGSLRLIGRAFKDIGARMDGLQLEVVRLFRGIRVVSTNATEDLRTVYAMTPREMELFGQRLQYITDTWLAEGRESYGGFWWSGYDEEATRLGTAQTVANLQGLSKAYKVTRTISDVIRSEEWRNRVAMSQLKSMEHWTGLASTTRAELSRVVGVAVAEGRSPRRAVTDIAAALDVTRAKARQYAQTDITDTLRGARWAEAEYAQRNLGIRLALLWTSALQTFTRQTHAARHGRTYTSDEVREFYSRDGNVYKCHCATTECLIGDDGKPILTEKLKSTMAKARATWNRAYKN